MVFLSVNLVNRQKKNNFVEKDENEPSKNKIKNSTNRILFENRIFVLRKLIKQINVIMLVSYTPVGPEKYEMIRSDLRGGGVPFSPS
jgi:hypothetical protein